MRRRQQHVAAYPTNTSEYKAVAAVAPVYRKQGAASFQQPPPPSYALVPQAYTANGHQQVQQFNNINADIKQQQQQQQQQQQYYQEPQKGATASSSKLTVEQAIAIFGVRVSRLERLEFNARKEIDELLGQVEELTKELDAIKQPSSSSKQGIVKTVSKPVSRSTGYVGDEDEEDEDAEDLN